MRPLNMDPVAPSPCIHKSKSIGRGGITPHRNSTAACSDSTSIHLSNLRNREKIAALHRTYPGRLHLRAPPEATPVALLRQATSAARINDARVLTTASGREKSIHQWEELRMFDPGD